MLRAEAVDTPISIGSDLITVTVRGVFALRWWIALPSRFPERFVDPGGWLHRLRSLSVSYYPALTRRLIFAGLQCNVRAPIMTEGVTHESGRPTACEPGESR